MRIALGLEEGLDRFASDHQALTWKRWASADPAAFRAEFLREMGVEENEVHFKLDGLYLDSPLAAAQRAAANPRTASTTDWELLEIRQHPEWWARITWWKGGQTQANPFG